jgi:DNA polymerase-3 subunit gamma/tau
VTTALYRRYRPDTFEDVIGQDHVTVPLRTALQKNRVNHAYLFSGPRGCGKTTSARILARCLNCEQGPTPTPCGTCPSCLDLATGGPGSLDVIEIDAASHGGVDDARDLRERATFAPARDRYKIFIIDEAHMVTSAGFNALLKIVEEPPEHIKFIFATTEPEKVIGTIRSRTHHYPFRLVPPEPMIAYAQKLCDEEHVQVAPGVLPLVVRAGGGSVRDTLSVLDQLMAGAGQDGMSYDLAVSLLGYTHGELLDDVVDALAARDASTVFGAVDRVIQSGLDPRRFVEDLLERFRDLIVVRAVPDAATVLHGVPQDQVERMAAQAAPLGPSELSRWGDVTNAALSEMTGATSPRLHLELLCARLLLPSADDSERGLASRVDRIERNLSFGGAPVEAGSAMPDAAGPATAAGSPSATQGAAAPQGSHQGVSAPAPAAPGWGSGPSGAAAARQALRAARGEQAPAQQPATSATPEPAAASASPQSAQASAASAGSPAAPAPRSHATGAAAAGSTNPAASPEPAQASAASASTPAASSDSAPAAPRPAAPRPAVPNLPSMPGMVSASTLPTPPPKPHPTDDPVPDGPVDLDALEAQARKQAEEAQAAQDSDDSRQAAQPSDVPGQAPASASPAAQPAAHEPAQQPTSGGSSGAVADFVPTEEELAAAQEDDEFEPAELAADDPEVVAAQETEESPQVTTPTPGTSAPDGGASAPHRQPVDEPREVQSAPQPEPVAAPQPQTPAPSRPQPTPGPQHSPNAAADTPAGQGQVPHPQGGSGSVEMFRRAWPQIMDHLKNARRFVWSMVEPHVSVAGFDGRTLVLSFAHPGPMRAFRQRPDAMQLLQASIQDVLGVSPEIDVTEGGQGPTPGRGEPGPKVEGRTPPAAPTHTAAPASEPAPEATAPVAPRPSAPSEQPAAPVAPVPAASAAHAEVEQPPAAPSSAAPSAPSGTSTASADSPASAGSPASAQSPVSAASPASSTSALSAQSANSAESASAPASAASSVSAASPAPVPSEPTTAPSAPAHSGPSPTAASPSGPTFHGKAIDPSLIVDLEEPWDEDAYGPEPEDPSYALAPSRAARPQGRAPQSGRTAEAGAPAPAHESQAPAAALPDATPSGTGPTDSTPHAAEPPAAPRPAAAPRTGGAAAPRPHAVSASTPDEVPVAPRPGAAPSGTEKPAAPKPVGETPAAPMPGATKGWSTPPQSGWSPTPTEEAPAPAAPAPPQGKLSRYQRLMAQAKSSEQSWGAPNHPTPAAPTPAEPEDFVPSDDDEELENSTTFGRQAFERLLDATLIEELDSNGQPVAHHR